MADSIPGVLCQIRKPQNVKDGTLQIHALGKQAQKKDDVPPGDSRVKFVGQRIFEYDEEKKAFRKKLAFPQSPARDFYQRHDKLPQGKFTRHMLARMFPDRVEDEKASIWDLLGDVLLGNEEEKYPLYYVITRIEPAGDSAWHGKIAFEALVHFGAEVGVVCIRSGVWNHFEFTGLVGSAETARSEEAFANLMEKGVGFALDVAVSMLTDGALKFLKGTKYARAALETRVATQIGKAFARVGARATGKAALAAVAAWGKAVAKMEYKHLTHIDKGIDGVPHETKIKLEDARDEAIKAFVATFLAELIGEKWLGAVAKRFGKKIEKEMVEKLIAGAKKGQESFLDKAFVGSIADYVKDRKEGKTQEADFAVYIKSRGLEHKVAEAAERRGIAEIFREAVLHAMGFTDAKPQKK